MHLPNALAALAFAVTMLAAVGVRAQSGWDIPHRGAIVYERTTEAFTVTPANSRMRTESLIAAAHAGGHEWRHLSGPHAAVPKGFEEVGFDDSGWVLGRSSFGGDAGKDAQQRTLWNKRALCLRTTVLMPRKPKALVFDVDHDDGIRIWLNGRLVVSNDSYGRGRRYVVAGSALKAAFRRGDNLLAVRCVDIGGAQYCDVALTAVHSLPPGVRVVADIERVLREDREGANRTRRELFGAYRPPALLLEGELDRDDQRVVIPPHDLREIAWWIATDIRSGATSGAVSAKATRMLRLGDLEIKGRVTAADTDGWQTIEAKLRSAKEPDLLGDSKRHVERHVLRFLWYGFEGTLRIRRRFEVSDAGVRVAEFTTALDGLLLRGKGRREPTAKVVQRESWRLSAVRDNQDAAFRAMVASALEKGVKRLRERLKTMNSGNLKAENPKGARSYHSGRLALGLLALIKGGLPKDDEVIQKGLAELRKRTLIDTYSLGNALMALEAYYAPGTEFGDLKSGLIDRPRKRTPSAEDKALMEKWTKRLLANVDRRVDEAYLMRWHYNGGADYDNSNNQYGLLGLFSAHLCGVEVPVTVWEAAANHLLATQCPEGKRFPLELVDYRTHARQQARPDEQFTTTRTLARPLGWSYKGPKAEGVLSPMWGSMTCAGITGLAICQAAIADHPDVKRVRLQNDANRARSDGFAWLAQNLTVRCHAGAIERQRRWFYYYLYSLERAALLSGIALIQDRDWYFEGAMVLSLAQRDDGNWPGELMPDPDVETNAMAILFLKQGTLPVLTGK